MVFGRQRFLRLVVTVMAAWGLALNLSACDQLGIDTPQKAAERELADAKAVGSACRHAMRAIEDCYVLNPKAEKSSVFAGWREMDEYMRENKLEGVAPVVPRPVAPPSAASKASAAAAASEADDEEDEAETESEPAGKGKGKAAKAVVASKAGKAGGKAGEH